jgi:hypothetical protein
MSEALHIGASFAASRSNSEDHFQLFVIAHDSVLTNSTTVLLYICYPAGEVLWASEESRQTPPARMALLWEKYGVAFDPLV